MIRAPCRLLPIATVIVEAWREFRNFEISSAVRRYFVWRKFPFDESISILSARHPHRCRCNLQRGCINIVDKVSKVCRRISLWFTVADFFRSFFFFPSISSRKLYLPCGASGIGQSSSPDEIVDLSASGSFLFLF